MTDPFRLRVVKAISQSLSEISIADGYNFDFADAVFRGRISYGDSDPIPMISILEAPLPNEKANSPYASSTDSGTWEIIVQGFVKDDRENPTDPAHLAMGDVKKKLALEKKRPRQLPARGYDPFGLDPGNNAPNRIEDFKIGAGVVRPPEEGVSTKAYFWLTLTLKIVEDNSNPFG